MKEAQALSLVGWVRNTDQGTVEGEAQGRPDKLAEFKVRAYDTVYIYTCTRRACVIATQFLCQLAALHAGSPSSCTL